MFLDLLTLLSRLVTIPRPASAQKKKDQATFSLARTVHAAESSTLPDPPPQPAHNYTVTLEASTYTDEKFALFEQYQRLIHHEGPSRISKSGFRNFLCDSPLMAETRDIASSTSERASAAEVQSSNLDSRDGGKRVQKLGTYHQLHRLDGKLIAMSVLDLLPHAVSAVYFIYLATPFTTTLSQNSNTTKGGNPSTKATNAMTQTTTIPVNSTKTQTTDLSSFSPGTLSALREALFALEYNHTYYYMGYYIHSCAKMRYKALFKPQYVLDPCTYGWDAFDGDDDDDDDTGKTMGVGKALDQKKFVSMSDLRARAIRDQNVTDDDDDETQTIPYPTPLLASRTSPSIFALSLPGTPTLSTLQSQLDLDHDIKLQLKTRDRAGRVVDVITPFSQLSGVFERGSWDGGSAGGGLKGVVGELVAVLGAEVAREVVVKLH